MDCELARSLMSSYIDKDINEIDKIELEKHLESCKDCIEEYSLLLSAVKYCNELEEIELPENFHQDLKQKLQELGSNNAKKRFFKRNWSWIAGVVAVFVVVFISISSLPEFNFGSAKAAKEEIEYDASNFTAQSVGAVPADGNNIKVEFSQEVDATPTTGKAENYATRGIAPFDADRQKATFNESVEEIPAIASVGKNKVAITYNAVVEEPEAAIYERKIITSGSVFLEVTDFDSKMKNLSDLAVRNGGYVENSNAENNVYYESEGRSNKLKTGSITLRIPAAKFSSAMEEVKALGEVINQNSNSVDITDQYYDTSVRVDNLKVQEARLRELVSMTKNVDEILKIERELNRVRSEIELMSTDIKRWDKQVDLSSLYVNLREVKAGKLETVNVPTIWTKAYKGFLGAINNILRATEKLFIYSVTVVPYIIILAVIFIAGFIILRRRRLKNIK